MPIRLKALLQETYSPDQNPKLLEEAEKQIEQRDEYEALEAATIDLVRPLRYERRAWYRQKRALRQFTMIKSNTLYKGVATDN